MYGDLGTLGGPIQLNALHYGPGDSDRGRPEAESVAESPGQETDSNGIGCGDIGTL